MFERSVGLVILWLRSYTSDIGLVKLLYISIEAGLGISVASKLILVFYFEQNVWQGYNHDYTREYMCRDY